MTIQAACRVTYATPPEEPTNLFWVMRDGERKRVDRMSHSHLIFTVLMLRRQGARALRRVGLPVSVGTVDEVLLAAVKPYNAMLFELRRRRIDAARLTRPPSHVPVEFPKTGWTSRQERRLRAFRQPELPYEREGRRWDQFEDVLCDPWGQS